jgi:hypothetical protein
MWFDIRWAAREQDSIAGLDQLRGIERGLEGGHQHRKPTRAERYGVDVLLADHLEKVLSKQPAVGRDSDDGQPRHV